ncbi:MAG TPA: class I SAM-dependent methyltransferase [Solirubrobacterales bacterium]|nr:class I SAM-dependent methyltransferase [Solirubrobacterales bacterium]
MAAEPNLEQVKAKQQATWSSGDYAKIAWLTVPLADVLCDAVDLRPGSRVVDVATGTGHVALAAARRFCEVTGIDYVPALVEGAQRRAEAEGLEVDFREGDAESLPFEDGSFDYVLSAIGVMFTADHQRTASELTRVCRPQGIVGFVNWTPTGFVGQMLKAVGAHVPPPPGVQPPPRWGTEDYVRELLGDRVSELSFETGAVAARFLSAEHYADFFIEHYGPTRKASEALAEGAARDAFRSDLVELGERANRAADGPGIVTDWEYLVTVARRAE